MPSNISSIINNFRQAPISPQRGSTPTSNVNDEQHLLQAFFKALDKKQVTFEAANQYGLSAQGLGASGQQLHNSASDGFKFRVHRMEQNAYAFEAAPGLYIGVGQRHRRYCRAKGFKSVLVTKGDPSALFRIVPARNGSDLYFSLESIREPGHLLNHCDGKMWLFSCPANNETVFSEDSSWKVVESIEETIRRLPKVQCQPSQGSVGICPVCFEPWSDMMQVVTPCGHTFCLGCVVDICKMMPPSTEGECALCRAPVTLDSLRRVASSDQASYNNRPDNSPILVGEWFAPDLSPGGDPGGPDESLIAITEYEIEFPNGGGGFANGPYAVDPNTSSYTAYEGDETIKFELDGDQLKVCFAGGDYGDATTVLYNKVSSFDFFERGETQDAQREWLYGDRGSDEQDVCIELRTLDLIPTDVETWEMDVTVREIKAFIVNRASCTRVEIREVDGITVLDDAKTLKENGVEPGDTLRALCA